MTDKDLESLSKEELQQEILRLRTGIREHRDAQGHDRCWLDDIDLYNLLPEKLPADTKLPEREEFLTNCNKFYENRQCPYKIK